jgi:hypothetical protein
MSTLIITHVIPDDTIRREAERDVEHFSGQELRICFAGNVIFSADGTTVLALEDVPLLGFESDYARALAKVETGSLRASFTDFYGEFEIIFVNAGNGDVRCVNTFTGSEFTTSLHGLSLAVSDSGLKLLKEIEEAFPQILANPNFAALRDEILNPRDRA